MAKSAIRRPKSSAKSPVKKSAPSRRSSTPIRQAARRPARKSTLSRIKIGGLSPERKLDVFGILLAFIGFLGNSFLEMISWLLMITGISSFMAMNFTGSSTFTSLSGVQKEMKTALPMQITFAGIGILGWIISRFI